MGTSGISRRKPKHPLAKVPKYEEPNDVHLAGLAESSNIVSGTRLGHSSPHGRSQDLGRVGRFFLACLGRRPPKKEEPESD